MALQAPPPAIANTPEVASFVALLTNAWIIAGRPAVAYSSWWRSAYDNARVGGHPNSQHLSGLAVDVPSRTASLGARRFVQAAGLVGLVVVDEGDHWHVQRYGANQGRGGLCCGAAAAAAQPPSILDRIAGFVAKPRFSLLDFF